MKFIPRVAVGIPVFVLATYMMVCSSILFFDDTPLWSSHKVMSIVAGMLALRMIRRLLEWLINV